MIFRLQNQDNPLEIFDIEAENIGDAALDALTVLGYDLLVDDEFTGFDEFDEDAMEELDLETQRELFPADFLPAEDIEE